MKKRRNKKKACCFLFFSSTSTRALIFHTPSLSNNLKQRLITLLFLAALAATAYGSSNPCTSTESRAGTIEYSASGPPNATTFAFTLTPTPGAAAEKLPLSARIGPIRSGPPAIASLGLRLSDAVAIEGGSALRNASPAGTRAVVDGAPTFTWVVSGGGGGGGSGGNSKDSSAQQQQPQTFSVTLVANSEKAAAAAGSAGGGDATNSSSSSAAASSTTATTAAPAPLASLCSQTPVGGGGPSPLVSKVPVGGTCVFTLRTADGGCGYFVLTSKLARAGNEAKGSSELPSAGGRRRRRMRRKMER